MKIVYFPPNERRDMFRENSPENEPLSFFLLTGENIRDLENSWAGGFYREVFCEIDETVFEPLYSKKFSRPNIPVNILVGAILLKEKRKLKDEILVEHLTWNLQYRWALGIRTNPGSAPFSLRTLTYFRTALKNYKKETGIDLIHEAVAKLPEGLVEPMDIDLL